MRLKKNDKLAFIISFYTQLYYKTCRFFLNIGTVDPLTLQVLDNFQAMQEIHFQKHMCSRNLVSPKIKTTVITMQNFFTFFFYLSRRPHDTRTKWISWIKFWSFFLMKLFNFSWSFQSSRNKQKK